MKNKKKKLLSAPAVEKVERYGNRGIVELKGNRTVSFEVAGGRELNEIDGNQYRNLYRQYVQDNRSMQLGDYQVALWGSGHNLYPQEVYAMISDNKLLPEILSKQSEFLYGRGPYLYQEEIVGEGKDARKMRVPVYDKEVQDWLDGWEKAGLDDYRVYLKDQIVDYYHVKTCVSQYRFNRSRRIPGVTNVLPVIGLEYVGADRARLCSYKAQHVRALRDKELTHVAIGDWLNPSMGNFEVFPRFIPSDPLRFPTCVSMVKDKTFSKDIYAYNEWFNGLREWIKGSNLTPRYINSYLKNALNAFLHVEIPAAWISTEERKIQSFLASNYSGAGNIVASYEGVTLVDEQNNALDYSDAMMDQRIAHELRKITTLLSGEGTNQGKLWASTRYGEEGWKFNDFPGKFKEYFDSVISYDKRADQVVIAGLGISSSISNVENDGVLSKSGSDVYYNFLVYQLALTIPEFIVTRDINRAIRINFPNKQLKLGLQMDIPARQAETTPSDRMSNTTNR